MEATKYRKLRQAKEVKHSVIYGIVGDEDLEIVYIGKTTNFYKRFENYLYYKPKNSALAEWMSKNGWHIIILESNPPDMNYSEKTWIKKLKPQLFNMVDGGDQNWRHHDRKPWMAGRNIKCPSDSLLLLLQNRCREKYLRSFPVIKRLRDNMTLKNRVMFEVNLAMDFYEWGGGSIRKSFDRWLSYTKGRLIECLEKA